MYHALLSINITFSCWHDQHPFWRWPNLWETLLCKAIEPTSEWGLWINAPKWSCIEFPQLWLSNHLPKLEPQYTLMSSCTYYWIPLCITKNYMWCQHVMVSLLSLVVFNNSSWGPWNELCIVQKQNCNFKSQYKYILPQIVKKSGYHSVLGSEKLKKDLCATGKQNQEFVRAFRVPSSFSHNYFWIINNWPQTSKLSCPIRCLNLSSLRLRWI